MPEYKYLIVGTGMTGESALHGIRAVDKSGSIGMIGNETHRPYNRPPLSKGLWKGKPLESIFRKDGVPGVTFHFGQTARALDPARKQVTDAEGTVYSFDKLLLATGCSPRRLPFGGDQIIYFRTLADYQRLHQLAESGKRFIVIGGGFIGSEIAAALAMHGKSVSLVFPGEAICGHLFPHDLADSVTEFYREQGVDVMAGTVAAAVEVRADHTLVKLSNTEDGCEREVTVDAIVAGIGVEPNIELAKAAGLEINNGIRVDASLSTSRPDIYAAGDVASFYNPSLGHWMRVEHEDNANTMGELAGRAMAGEKVNYDYLPSFYSDMFTLGYEAVGHLDSRMETISDWKETFREGVVYYLHEGRVRGVLLWNVWDQVDAARKLIASPGPFTAADLPGRLPAAG